MKTEVYYFSGTGNSLYAAKDIAELIDAEFIPIAAAVKQEAVHSDADVVGIVFPVYISELPVIVKEFAEKLKSKAGYIFAVATFGGASGMSLIMLKDILAKNGMRLNAGFGLHMPQNAFYKFWEKPEKLFEKWQKEKAAMADKITSRREGMFLPNPGLEFTLRKLHNVWIRRSFRKTLMEMTGADESAETDGMMRMSDKSYTVSDACSGCGVCSEVCPMGNIEIADGKPIWGGACEGCLACLNYCPKNAISGGFAVNGHRYRNPHIKITEIKAQRGVAPLP